MRNDGKERSHQCYESREARPASGWELSSSNVEGASRTRRWRYASGSTVTVTSNGREGKGHPRDLLSYHINVVRRLQLEAAVVGPEVDRCADASDAALVYLLRVSLVFLVRPYLVRLVVVFVILPSPPLRCQQWQTPGRHTSSSIRRTAGSARGRDRRCLG